MDERVHQRIREAAETGATELDLGGMGLREIPRTLWELKHIEELNLSCNRLGLLPAEIGQLTNLVGLYLGANELTHLPPEIGKLTKLRDLYIPRNRLTGLPAQIGRLTSLTELVLHGNALLRLPPQTGRLTNLTVLNLSGHRLTLLPAQIGRLTNLVELNLSGNGLTHLPAQIGRLTNLLVLILANNRLTHLPAQIGRLTKLLVLDLAGNRLAHLPAQIGQLTRLGLLSLADNRLAHLPTQIRRLASLGILNLSHNALPELPSAVAQLPDLDDLNVRGDPLRNVPGELEQPARRYSGFDLQRLRDHFRDLEAGAVLDRELKLIVLGNGRVGKTSTVRRLIDGDFDPSETSTHGIEMRQWQEFPLEDGTALHVNVWDFGGQDIYHGTHGLFMKCRCVFLVVWNEETERSAAEGDGETPSTDHPVDYWLDYVEGVSPGAPVIVVQNRCDAAQQDRGKPVERGDIAHCRFSAKTGRCKGDLMGALASAFSQELGRTAGLEIGAGRRAVREEIRRLQAEGEQRTMSVAEFGSLCRAQGDKVASPWSLLHFLHDSGVVHYNGQMLGDIIVLDQRWAVDAIYALLDPDRIRDRLLKNGGRFSLADLDELGWRGKYTEEQQELLLRFMESCDICFDIGWSDEPPGITYLAPSLTPEPTASELRAWRKLSRGGLRYWHECEFLHQGTTRKFMARVGRTFGNSAVFRKDCVWIDVGEELSAWVRYTWEPKAHRGTIDIQLSGGTEREQADLLHAIGSELREIGTSRPSEEYISAKDGPRVGMRKLKEAAKLGFPPVLGENGSRVDTRSLAFVLEVTRHASPSESSAHSDPGKREADAADMRGFDDFASGSPRGKRLSVAEAAAILARSPSLAEARDNGMPEGLIGRSPELLRVFHTVKALAQSSVSVMLVGESGTGKEVVAEALHALSSRRDGPLEIINCAALPETLIESELFGHEKGAFTDAKARNAGAWEMAGGGTLFLDELQGLSPAAQAKVLRAADGKPFKRVGGSQDIAPDARLVSATSRPVRSLEREGKLRSDLSYRLGGSAALTLPPLRSRREDIKALAQHLLASVRPEACFTEEALIAMVAYHWPGNIRELKYCVEYACGLSGGRSPIGVEHLPPAVLASPSPERSPSPGSGSRGRARILDSYTFDEIRQVLSDVKAQHPDWGLTETKVEAAKRLGCGKSTLHSFIAEHASEFPGWSRRSGGRSSRGPSPDSA